jgi:hypothetical protein
MLLALFGRRAGHGRVNRIAVAPPSMGLLIQREKDGLNIFLNALV